MTSYTQSDDIIHTEWWHHTHKVMTSYYCCCYVSAILAWSRRCTSRPQTREPAAGWWWWVHAHPHPSHSHPTSLHPFTFLLATHHPPSTYKASTFNIQWVLGTELTKNLEPFLTPLSSCNGTHRLGWSRFHVLLLSLRKHVYVCVRACVRACTSGIPFNKFSSTKSLVEDIRCYQIPWPYEYCILIKNLKRFNLY